MAAQPLDFIMSKAEIDTYRKQPERLGRRPKFTDGMRMRLVEKAMALGRRMRDVVTIVRPDTAAAHGRGALRQFKISQARQGPPRH